MASWSRTRCIEHAKNDPKPTGSPAVAPGGWPSLCRAGRRRLAAASSGGGPRRAGAHRRGTSSSLRSTRCGRTRSAPTATRPAATPWIDRLAAGGVRFSTARAHNVVTLPSHANILSGRLPPDHGVRDNAGFRLAASDADARDAARRRAAFAPARSSAPSRSTRASAWPAGSTSTTTLRGRTPRPALLEQERAGAETVAPRGDGSARAARGAAEPSFAWVHLFEPHAPLCAARAVRDRGSRGSVCR